MAEQFWSPALGSRSTGGSCTLALARAVFEVAVEEKSAVRFTIRSRTRVVQRHPKGDW